MFWPAVGAVAGIALCTLAVVHESAALFNATTSNDNNSWSTGTVALSDDDSGSALFDPANEGTLSGGQTVTKCIKVQYDGTITGSTNVKLYGVSSGALSTYLNLTIDQGSGGGAGSCTGFTSTSPGIYTGTLAGFTGSAVDYSTGVGSWSPASTGATMTYRFTVSVQSVAAAQNKTATATFTWEARA